MINWSLQCQRLIKRAYNNAFKHKCKYFTNEHILLQFIKDHEPIFNTICKLNNIDPIQYKLDIINTINNIPKGYDKCNITTTLLLTIKYSIKNSGITVNDFIRTIMNRLYIRVITKTSKITFSNNIFKEDNNMISTLDVI